ncbi:MAG: hypothetical protein EXR93_11435 [Gemmatimonadetes bacterium]|nr:hypothetical protein [Gemmatimonadota bacterium]
MPDSESPEFAALAELEVVVRQVSDELAAWRRRAQKAEIDRPGSTRGESSGSLEADNAELKRRLDATRGRVEELLKRLRFLEEQASVHEVR